MINISPILQVYNVSIVCSVKDASPNFLAASTNPDSVSIVVVVPKL